MKSELVHNDIANQKKNLELRLLRRRVKRNNSKIFSKNYPKIGIEEETNEEISCIMTKMHPGLKNESWNDEGEDNSLLKEFQSTKDKTNSTFDYFGEDENTNE